MFETFTNQFSPAVLPFVVVVSAAIVLAVRYAAIAGGAYWLTLRFAERLTGLRIQKTPFSRAQLRHEIKYSAMSIGVFALLAAGLAALNGGVGITTSPMPTNVVEWMWAIVGVPLALLAHDFYFYWAHRLLHADWLYPHVHRLHHASTNPSPFAALAFHPVEALIEAAGVLGILALAPLPLPSLIAFSLIAFAFNVLGHLGYELFPKRWMASWFGRWFNSATSHNLHHRTFRYQYGLYTQVWDRAFGTVHPRYDANRALVMQREVEEVHRPSEPDEAQAA